MKAAPDSPVRVVYFAGPYLEPSAVRFVAMLDAHPDVELVLGLCEGEGSGLLHRLRNVWRRRGLLAVPVVALELLQALGRIVFQPRETLDLRRRSKLPMSRFMTVPNVHAPEVLERVRAAQPDVGVVYGGPILKPELFRIPRLGTLGIHHGRVPQYRGKKTTFWEMYNGEQAAGVTIQRIGSGIDTGEIVRTGEVPIGSKSYGRVWREVEDVGRQLFLQAILEVGRGTARFVAQDAATPRGALYRQPRAADIVRFSLRRMGLRRYSAAKGER
jgi:folate-dependent phosphoribosylglycinamide formyltransferase PurN